MSLTKKGKIILIVSSITVLLVGAAVTTFLLLKNKKNVEDISYDHINIALPSESTGSETGTLAVRIFLPENGNCRYSEGAPIIIQAQGGTTSGSFSNTLPQMVNDVVFIEFLFPGGTDHNLGLSSDGVYDYRGMNSIRALRDVIKFAAGKLASSEGKTIEEIVPVNLLLDNIGLIGSSNGGNIIFAVIAQFGEEFADDLDYIIQWESPVSSQAATVDFGKIKLGNANEPGDFFNPRFLNYGKLVCSVNYSDLVYNPTDDFSEVFHDGNGDGIYTTVEDPITGYITPDLNLDGMLNNSEDFPLEAFTDGFKMFYSRPVTAALAINNVIAEPNWPSTIATPIEAEDYWDIREAVRCYEAALTKIPDLKGMILCHVNDHVQSAPNKFHIHQAFDGLKDAGAWVKINPDPSYLIAINPEYGNYSNLPENEPNNAPSNWLQLANYCEPQGVTAGFCQAAAIWEMVDRVYDNSWTEMPTLDAKMKWQRNTLLFSQQALPKIEEQ